MGFINRNDAAKTFEGGSSKLAVFLLAAQCDEIWEGLTAPVGGWATGMYSLSILTGGDMGRDVDVEVERDEAGNEIKTVVKRDDIVIGNAARQTDDYTLRLLDWLETHYVPGRYPLPAGHDDAGNALHQVWCMPHVRVDKESWKQNTADGAKRQRSFTLRSVKRNDEGPGFYQTVRLDDQDNWPASMAPYKDSRAA